ncbi:MAG: phosphoribosylformylglycinamidine synthase subunit PurS [Bacteroidia bacterium]|nr:phosphoribosylformylglycinamidine synthase subunit PurS [Bacteroidia bacterium]
MKFKAAIHIMPRKEILDPQGKATQLGLHNLGFAQMDQVRIGKRIEMEVEAADEAAARESVEAACRKLLANTITEQFQFELHPAA